MIWREETAEEDAGGLDGALGEDEGEGDEAGMEDSHKELAMFEKITEYLNRELAGMCIRRRYSGCTVLLLNV